MIELEESILSPSLMIGVSDKDGGKGDDDEEDEIDDDGGNEDDDEDDDSDDDIITIIIETNKYVYKQNMPIDITIYILITSYLLK